MTSIPNKIFILLFLVFENKKKKFFFIFALNSMYIYNLFVSFVVLHPFQASLQFPHFFFNSISETLALLFAEIYLCMLPLASDFPCLRFLFYYFVFLLCFNSTFPVSHIFKQRTECIKLKMSVNNNKLNCECKCIK